MVDLDDYVDMEVVANPMYWGIIIVIGFLFIVGYKLQPILGQGQMPVYYVILTLVLMPVILYFVCKYWVLR